MEVQSGEDNCPVSQSEAGVELRLKPALPGSDPILLASGPHTLMCIPVHKSYLGICFKGKF